MTGTHMKPRSATPSRRWRGWSRTLCARLLPPSCRFAVRTRGGAGDRALVLGVGDRASIAAASRRGRGTALAARACLGDVSANESANAGDTGPVRAARYRGPVLETATRVRA